MEILTAIMIVINLLQLCFYVLFEASKDSKNTK